MANIKLQDIHLRADDAISNLWVCEDPMVDGELLDEQSFSEELLAEFMDTNPEGIDPEIDVP